MRFAYSFSTAVLSCIHFFFYTVATTRTTVTVETGTLQDSTGSKRGGSDEGEGRCITSYAVTAEPNALNNEDLEIRFQVIAKG